MGTRKLLALSYGLLNRVTTTTKNTDMSQTHIKEDREPNDSFLLNTLKKNFLGYPGQSTFGSLSGAIKFLSVWSS